MNRCQCSFKAFDVLAEDLSCFRLRQERAQRVFKHARGFANRSRLGHRWLSLETYIDRDNVARNLCRLQKARAHFQAVKSWPRAPTAARNVHTGPVDSVQPAQSPSLQTDTKSLQTDAKSTSMPGVAAEPSIAVNPRTQRKLRRIADGKYRPGTQSQNAREAEGCSSQPEQVTFELSIDEAKDGAVAKRRNEQATTTEKAEQASDDSKSKRETWQVQKAALQSKFGDNSWQPRKRLSPDTMDGIRALHNTDPSTYSTPVLAAHFKISPENIRRILRSKWQPSEDEKEERRLRWEKRGVRKWSEMAELGMKPPVKWRILGAGAVDRKAGEVPKWKRAEEGGLKARRPDWQNMA